MSTKLFREKLKQNILQAINTTTDEFVELDERGNVKV